MSELPEGWERVALNEIGDITTGNTPPTKQPENYGGIIPFVKPGDLDTNRPIINSEQTLSEKGAKYARLLRAGAVLVSCIGNLGKVGIAGVPLTTNQQINAIEFESLLVDDRYGYHYCKTLRSWMEDEASATTVTILNKGKFAKAPFALAPLAEQKRIADKLDALLMRVDACRERLERVPLILKRFRQAVLAEATSGRLTEDWREETDCKFDWQRVRISDVGEIGRGKSKHRPRNDPRLYGGPYPFIQTGDVAQSGGFITQHSQTYSEFGLSQSKLWPTGTVCITIAANIADTAILTYPACFPDSVVGFIANPRKSLPQFMKWSIDVIRDDLESFAPATAQKNINLAVLNDIEFELPSIAEQHEIVRRVETLFTYADRLEARYLAARARVERLTPALLAKAFRGELAPQDPADEPASILLERIRAARAAEDGKPKKRGAGAKAERLF